MEELAERLAESVEDIEDAEALVARWNGAPEKICEDIFRARNPDTGEMDPIKVFPYQKKFLHAYFFGDSTILNAYKGRRIGISFVAAMAVIIDGLIHPRMSFPIVATSLDHAQDRIEDIQTLLEHSPLPFDEVVEVDNKGEIVLYNESSFKAYTANPDKIRGISAKTVLIDEMAFIEGQEELIAAAMPTISLGSRGKVLEISTPRVSNDLFMETNKRGRQGASDVIAIKQPTFKNADEVDIMTPLTEQSVEVVRPDMNPEAFESQRLTDPMGFAQEYLCRPVSDEYRFLSKETVADAQRRGARRPEEYDEGSGGGKYSGWSPATHARKGGRMIAGVDIGLTSDNTAVAVFEHVGNKRLLRFHTLLDREDLRALNVYPEDPANPDSVATYLYRLAENMHIEKVFLDMTGPGGGFQRAVQHKLGRRAQGFDFNDKRTLERMWGDVNFGLHKGLVTLVPDNTMYDQLCAIVKEQTYDDQVPRFSGKDYAEDGKDDLAMAVMLGLYPPNYKADRGYEPIQRENISGEEFDDATEPVDAEGEYRGGDVRAVTRTNYGTDKGTGLPKGVRQRAYGSTRNPSSRRYSARHSRRNTR